jgi:hypothetical protein
MNGSLRFGTYGIFKRWALGERPESEFGDVEALLCGAMCGAVSVPISHPLDGQPSLTSPYLAPNLSANPRALDQSKMGGHQ